MKMVQEASCLKMNAADSECLASHSGALRSKKRKAAVFSRWRHESKHSRVPVTGSELKRNVSCDETEIPDKAVFYQTFAFEGVQSMDYYANDKELHLWGVTAFSGIKLDDSSIKRSVNTVQRESPWIL
ncbi:Hypothetical protein SMAX5B_018984 [Scophthalmus maximus]|uniref:Uncharacterized protein n=1 Tax=Scophthalmus maximus TaxID=52904 RepID=A0A2U9CBP3_SCOMX|nr:Hypothetical protein SMAX5B_018984 [Scophthalmus maximus]